MFNTEGDKGLPCVTPLLIFLFRPFLIVETMFSVNSREICSANYLSTFLFILSSRGSRSTAWYGDCRLRISAASPLPRPVCNSRSNNRRLASLVFLKSALCRGESLVDIKSQSITFSITLQRGIIALWGTIFGVCWIISFEEWEKVHSPPICWYHPCSSTGSPKCCHRFGSICRHSEKCRPLQWPCFWEREWRIGKYPLPNYHPQRNSTVPWEVLLCSRTGPLWNW